MKYFDRKVVARYLYDQLTGNFAGFLIGISATSLVSQFFETRSLKNLWGLGAKKTVIDKDTFSNLEWIISIVIGFVAFEIMTKVVKGKIDRHFPAFRFRILRWLVRNNWHTGLQTIQSNLRKRRITFFTGVHTTLKSTLNRYSQR